MPEIFIHPFEKFTLPLEDGGDTYWRSQGGNAIGRLDYRSLNQMDILARPEGYGLHVYAIPQSGMELSLGNDLRANITAVQRSGIQRTLGVTVLENRLDLVLRELWLAFGDPTGQNSWKPGRGSLAAGPELIIGGLGLIFSNRLTRSHPAFNNTVAIFQADYRNNRTLVTSDAELNQLRRYTGKSMLKLGITDSDDLLPVEHRSDGSLSPATTFTDIFTNSDAVQIEDHTPTGGGFAWELMTGGMEIISNKCRIDFTATNARIASDTGISDDAFHIEAELEGDATTVTLLPGLIVRKHATLATNDYYRAYLDTKGNTVTLDKVVAGSSTQLSQISFGVSADVQYFTEYEVTAADVHTVDIDTVEKINLTDSSITGNTKFGMIGRTEGGGKSQIDDLLVNDLAGAGPTRRIFIIS